MPSPVSIESRSVLESNSVERDDPEQYPFSSSWTLEETQPESKTIIKEDLLHGAGKKEQKEKTKTKKRSSSVSSAPSSSSSSSSSSSNASSPVPTNGSQTPRMGGVDTSVTLSGLLNALDGAGLSEERWFFCTTNWVDHTSIDPTLLRPARSDVCVESKLEAFDSKQGQRRWSTLA
ncbi:hypothetical protein I316_02298 [Kwoniella heveanensis BCC8398]|uniref:Uncharacterized protein n=1 Tax=Kwoniella heveanensis BCC8398 TaxID=1296120 RepID=A0A1B9GXX5_9TREE|nr:hypothetical protein I316_02298 [Kwoniella heveanensis BCC8398]